MFVLGGPRPWYLDEYGVTADTISANPAFAIPVKIPGPDIYVKATTRDITNRDGAKVTVDALADQLFQDLGAIEMSVVSRNDLINGKNVLYQPIKNLANIGLKYNPMNIIKLQKISSEYFGSFTLDFNAYVPDVGTGLNGQTVYVDADTANIIINTVNVRDFQRVEVEFLKITDLFDDTIY